MINFIGDTWSITENITKYFPNSAIGEKEITFPIVTSTNTPIVADGFSCSRIGSNWRMDSTLSDSVLQKAGCRIPDWKDFHSLEQMDEIIDTNSDRFGVFRFKNAWDYRQVLALNRQNYPILHYIGVNGWVQDQQKYYIPGEGENNIKKSFSIVGLFNKEFSNLLLKVEEEPTIFGQPGAYITEIADKSSPEVKYTIGKLERVLQALKYFGIITVKVLLTSNNIYQVVDLLPYTDPPIYYDLLYRIHQEDCQDDPVIYLFLKDLLKSKGCNPTFYTTWKNNVKHIIETIYVAPYPYSFYSDLHPSFPVVYTVGEGMLFWVEKGGWTQGENGIVGWYIRDEGEDKLKLPDHFGIKEW